jgi:hypothetical protein
VNCWDIDPPLESPDELIIGSAVEGVVADCDWAQANRNTKTAGMKPTLGKATTFLLELIRPSKTDRGRAIFGLDAEESDWFPDWRVLQMETRNQKPEGRN